MIARQGNAEQANLLAQVPARDSQNAGGTRLISRRVHEYPRYDLPLHDGKSFGVQFLASRGDPGRDKGLPVGDRLGRRGGWFRCCRRLAAGGSERCRPAAPLEGPCDQLIETRDIKRRRERGENGPPQFIGRSERGFGSPDQNHGRLGMSMLQLPQKAPRDSRWLDRTQHDHIGLQPGAELHRGVSIGRRGELIAAASKPLMQHPPRRAVAVDGDDPRRGTGERSILDHGRRIGGDWPGGEVAARPFACQQSQVRCQGAGKISSSNIKPITAAPYRIEQRLAAGRSGRTHCSRSERPSPLK
jgi:hypothetical protein